MISMECLLGIASQLSKENERDKFRVSGSAEASATDRKPAEQWYPTIRPVYVTPMLGIVMLK